MPAPSRRNWFRFSLRGLLIVIAFASALLGWRLKQVRDVDKAEAAIERTGLRVNSMPEQPFAIRFLVGDSHTRRTVNPGWPRKRIDDAVVLGAMRDLCKMPQLECLVLSSTEVSDDILAHLGQLKDLNSLHLDQTSITDAGLIHLESLTQLKSIYMPRTNATDAGIERLRRALPDCYVSTEVLK